MKETTDIESIDFSGCLISPEKQYVYDTNKLRNICRVNADDEHKVIIFYYGFGPQVPGDLIYDKWTLKKSLYRRDTLIETSDLSSMSFDLLDKGYRIFLSFNDRCIELKPGMEGVGREIRYAHNIMKMTCAGVFNHLLDIPEL